MNRRALIESSAATAAATAVFGWPVGVAAQSAGPSIGIQIGAVSRKYSEMKLDNLRAAGRAIRESVRTVAR